MVDASKDGEEDEVVEEEEREEEDEERDEVGVDALLVKKGRSASVRKACFGVSSSSVGNTMLDC